MRGARRPSKPVAAAAAAPSPPPPPSSQRAASVASAPPFAALVLAALDAVGVSYVSMDLLRKAKRGAADEREHRTLWKLLHDLVLVVLADFAVDADALRRMNAPRELEAALWDADAQRVREELVCFYLYDWGFVCRSFYAGGATSADLLLALAWLLAFAKVFERLRAPILARWIGEASDSSSLVLPPYPNDVVLSEAQVAQAVSAVLATTSSRPEDPPTPAFETTIHQLHAAFGRLQGHAGDLAAQLRYHRRLLQQLETSQGRARDDELLPAFALQLLAQPKPALELHVRVLALRVQMLADEQLFYKWVNGVVAAYPEAPPAPRDALADAFPALHAQASSTHALFQQHAAAFAQLAQSFAREWRRRKQEKRAAQLQQAEATMARLADDVRARELFDPQTLFTQQQQLPVGSSSEAAQPPLPCEADVESLRRQLAHVIREISSEHCGAQLR